MLSHCGFDLHFLIIAILMLNIHLCIFFREMSIHWLFIFNQVTRLSCWVIRIHDVVLNIGFIRYDLHMYYLHLWIALFTLSIMLLLMHSFLMSLPILSIFSFCLVLAVLSKKSFAHSNVMKLFLYFVLEWSNGFSSLFGSLFHLELRFLYML